MKTFHFMLIHSHYFLSFTLRVSFCLSVPLSLSHSLSHYLFRLSHFHCLFCTRTLSFLFCLCLSLYSSFSHSVSVCLLYDILQSDCHVDFILSCVLVHCTEIYVKLGHYHCCLITEHSGDLTLADLDQVEYKAAGRMQTFVRCD